MNGATTKAPDFPTLVQRFFLEGLVAQRNASGRTVAAYRDSFLRYAAVVGPGSLGSIQRALAVPQKRFEKSVLGFRTRQEMDAILEAPDPNSWSGRRDRLLIQMMYNTGARVSETITITMKDIDRDHSH
jgi:integrase/recombinase XerD